MSKFPTKRRVRSHTVPSPTHNTAFPKRFSDSRCREFEKRRSNTLRNTEPGSLGVAVASGGPRGSATVDCANGENHRKRSAIVKEQARLLHARRQGGYFYLWKASLFGSGASSLTIASRRYNYRWCFSFAVRVRLASQATIHDDGGR